MIRVATIQGKMNTGGKKTLVMEYYRNMDHEEVVYDFICDSDSKVIPYDEIEKMGGRVILIRPYQRIFGNMIDIYKLCKENNYQVMHAFNSTMNLFPMFVAWLAKVPVRISESISMANKGDWRTPIKMMLRPMSKWFANRFMACGEICGQWQFGDKLYQEGKIAVFPSSIDTKKFQFDEALREKTRKAYGWEDKVVYGSVGRFMHQKNTVFMIDIIAEILKKQDNAILALVGDGELRDAVEERIKAYGIEDKVVLLGEREDVIQFYNAMDCFLLPSTFEGLPNVGFEAQSNGLPSIFSTEITREAGTCELAEFVDLSAGAKAWAEVAIAKTARFMPIRRSYNKEVADAGYDSAKGGKKLQQYYIDELRKELEN